MNATALTDPPNRRAPLALWRIAEAILHTLYNLFGKPEDLAAQDVLSRKAYALTLAWLRVAEAIMRRLLLIEAAAFVGVASPPSMRHAGSIRVVRAPRTRKLRTFTADKPEEWRASFRCFASSLVRKRSESHGSGTMKSAVETRLQHYAPRGGGRTYSSWPVAERYEALLRAFNDPIPYARRLARCLAAEPYRFEDVLSAPSDARDKIGPTAFALLTHSALSAYGGAFMAPKQAKADPNNSS